MASSREERSARPWPEEYPRHAFNGRRRVRQESFHAGKTFAFARSRRNRSPRPDHRRWRRRSWRRSRFCRLHLPTRRLASTNPHHADRASGQRRRRKNRRESAGREEPRRHFLSRPPRPSRFRHAEAAPRTPISRRPRRSHQIRRHRRRQTLRLSRKKLRRRPSPRSRRSRVHHPALAWKSKPMSSAATSANPASAKS